MANPSNTDLHLDHFRFYITITEIPHELVINAERVALAGLPTISVIGMEDTIMPFRHYSYYHHFSNIVNFLPTRLPVKANQPQSAEFILPHSMEVLSSLPPRIVPNSERTVPADKEEQPQRQQQQPMRVNLSSDEESMPGLE